MNETESKLRAAVKDLLGSQKVDIVIGHESGTLPFRARPCFVRDAGDAGKLVWNRFCANNLAVYLPALYQPRKRGSKTEIPSPKVGIVAKSCDARSVVGLVKEKQLPRDKVTIIAVPCLGMVDPGKLVARLDGEDVGSIDDDWTETMQVVTDKGRKEKVAAEQVLEDACRVCRFPEVQDADVTIEGTSRDAGPEQNTTVGEFEAKPVEQRWAFFENEMSKCVMCYACRQACPNCYCKVCFADQTKPRWTRPGNALPDVMLYHIGRIFHQAGRCVGCGACARACPMGVDIRTLAEKIGRDTEELFGYIPGTSWDELPPLCTYAEDDSESFITEP